MQLSKILYPSFYANKINKPTIPKIGNFELQKVKHKAVSI